MSHRRIGPKCFRIVSHQIGCAGFRNFKGRAGQECLNPLPVHDFLERVMFCDVMVWPLLDQFWNIRVFALS